MIPQTSHVGIDGKGERRLCQQEKKGKPAHLKKKCGGDKIYVLLLCCIYGYYLPLSSGSIGIFGATGKAPSFLVSVGWHCSLLILSLPLDFGVCG